MRINKLFSNYGICSRKETNKLIEEKRIKVNGEYCELGQWVEESDEIMLDDSRVLPKKKIYIALNKPVGITCTAEKNVDNNIIDFIKYPQYIFPVGRLDKDSQGLILMTNDGELANEILECDNMHEKEYIVEVNKGFSGDFVKQLSQGINITGNEGSGIKRISDTLGIKKNEINEKVLLTKESINKLNTIQLNSLSKNKANIVKTRPCKVFRINENSFRIILTQGLNRQIRKMCGALGFEVIKLERIRIMNIIINDMDIGKWRYLCEEEVEELRRLVSLND
ncbi:MULTISPECIES: pseudouridine synthase [unclassified Clostridium]|uniref:pseudouridine synthase n=1 Tax=unclassified Clostridium TaxID=2614128 RepID=UPI00029756DC|nr:MULTISPECIES: pseudouridine synthase [unclassified Clostridium]EKQ57028.1 MAG: pseudouridine synthase family protein [Clostridium sp. Maddingley MBC34-26]